MTCETYFIVYMEKGSLMRLHNGTTLFSHNEELFFIKSSRHHELSCNDPGSYTLNVPRELLYQFIQLLKIDISRIYAPTNIPSYITQPCHENTVSRKVIQELCSDGINGIGKSTMRRQFLMMALMSVFLENTDFLPLLKSALKKSMKEQMVTIITSDISKNWSTNKVAARLCISSSLLKKRLKEENTCYSRVILECRMQKARELLSLQRLSVKQTAYLCGYQNVSYFIIVFKRYYGCTPFEYNTEKHAGPDSPYNFCHPVYS
ncbi:helix-turn-helix domain-containing protein [Escherichia coli]|nr:helix-turn-helix domain-containing protein [Escherichia coli]EKY6647270.1 helix-turn-helix domain-containing protein [Escherichia coli]ELO3113694.1 helix-turn-helix domain-containing protein [Escherichia coli]ELO5043370.1 helix-turn-helix domain-containing protein [Escherichia coli]ELO5138831.1 helix-turn-helix domain-containing protein [Escherichia coli]